ncbi:hypothetical protein SAMN05428950_101168 [Sphingomonas sp. OV641]|uniref:hypothetical protein n=1 Tax=Sphingomonas sp. OV641 TaxID=1881068 RepID=UPI0008AC32FD|nr:hypothetical protein [Sphingomonas sp. OV641]SEI76966.1 hypothetical protein SAMN05428950_101168 [Sphingomonas sp. OV641]
MRAHPAARDAIFGLSALLLSLPAHAQESGPADTSGVEGPNTGQDVTDPVKRIDLRTGYEEGEDGSGTQTFILRHDRPVPLANGDQLALRMDLPFVANDFVTRDNPTGKNDIGFGDVLVQALYIHPVNRNEAFGVGSQLIVPTAGEVGFGGGKWRMVPLAGYRWAMNSISPGSFFVAAARWDFSFAGDDDRANVSNLQFGPTLNIALRDAAFVTLFPSTEIRYDFIKDSFFLPFNAAVGKLWGGQIITSLEGSAKMIGDRDAPYDWKIEARVGFLF